MSTWVLLFRIFQQNQVICEQEEAPETEWGHVSGYFAQPARASGGLQVWDDRYLQRSVLVRPEMERRRFPLVRHRYDHQAIPQHGCVPTEPAFVSTGKIHCSSSTSIRLN